MKDRLIVLATSVLTALLSPSFLVAATWTVDAGGGGDATTVAGGLTLASYGDTVLVSPGSYFENLIMKNGVVLRSRDGAAVTTLDGSDNGIILFCHAVDSTTTIEGFTLTHARGSYIGGAIACIDSASPRIAENIITDNTSLYGAAVGCVQRSSPRIERNEITDNVAANEGGGVYSYRYGHLVVRDNVFRRNVSMTQSGGAIWCRAMHGVIVTGNVMSDNRAEDYGGAVYASISVSPSPVQIEHNVFVRNHASWGGAICGAGVLLHIESNTIDACHATIRGGGVWNEYGEMELRRNIITHCTAGAVGSGVPASAACNDLWQNTDGDYFGGIGAGQGDIGEDPQFCDPTSGDYHLAASSPALEPACGQMGAFGEGCGATSTEKRSWGALRKLFK